MEEAVQKGASSFYNILGKNEKFYKKRFTFAPKTVIIFLVGKQGCIFPEKIKDIIFIKEKLRAKERQGMDAKEILWKYFLKTGEIGSYLLIKEIEDKDNNKIGGGKTEGERVSLERSDSFKEQGL